MSIEVRFSMSKGLNAPVTVPKGTLARITRHIAEVVSAISPCDGGALWGRIGPNVTDKTLCETARKHNEWLNYMWATMFPAAPHTGAVEQITPEDAKNFWFALSPIAVSMDRWTPEYTVCQLGDVFETLRGRAQHGVHFDAKPLSIEQASAAVYVVQHLLDLNVGDLDPEAPREWARDKHGRARLEWVDELQIEAPWGSGYDACDRCGPISTTHGKTNCPRRKCPLKEVLG